jgi:putative oxidoreductase
MFEQFIRFRDKLNILSDLPPLFFRLVLSYGFYGPATRKLGDIDSIAQWFGSMNYPLPTLNAYLATITETAGFILLFLGLATRLISIPLMFVMLVAIFTVHFGNGFAAGDNGFEIPLYYLLMIFSLFITGPGRISLDNLIEKQMKK